MFSRIPPIKNIDLDLPINSITKAFQLLHSTVNSISYRSVGESRQQESHCIFHYTVKGHGEVIYQGHPYITNPGDGFFNIINEANSGYGYPLSASEPWEFIVICFAGGNTRQIVKDMLEKQVIYNLNNQSGFYFLCEKLLDDFSSDAALCFFPKLISMLHEANKPQLELSSLYKNIVERDFLKNPTISTIASELQVSREHLQREFSRQIGMSPARYLRAKRFEYLCYLLTTQATDIQITELMHFPSVSGMSIFFKKHAGITPHQFRQNKYLLI